VGKRPAHRPVEEAKTKLDLLCKTHGLHTTRSLLSLFGRMSLVRNIMLTLCLLGASYAGAQFSEVGLTLGTTYYIGDLNPSRHFNSLSHFGGGLVYKYNFNNRYAFQLLGLFGRLEGDDILSDDPVDLQRNLHFKTTVWEASATVEVNFFEYRSGKNKRNYTPYLFAGLGYFRVDPRARIGDTWFDLQPLGTEGQGTSQSAEEQYNLDHLNLPFGVGFKATAGRMDFSIHWGLRRTWTDYIDDVSGNYVDNDILSLENGPLAGALADQNLSGTPNIAGVARGNAQTRDWYVYSGFTITYIISPRFLECYEQIQRLK